MWDLGSLQGVSRPRSQGPLGASPPLIPLPVHKLDCGGSHPQRIHGLMSYNQGVDAGEAGPEHVARPITLSTISTTWMRLIIRMAIILCCMAVCVPLVEVGTASTAGAAVGAASPGPGLPS